MHVHPSFVAALLHGEIQMNRLHALVALACLAVAGCGHISVYKSEGASAKPVGIKFYAPKPYILVSRTGAAASPVTVENIYLPDLANPYYAKTIPGLGSSKLTLAFANGILTNVGQETDPNVAGLMTALAGVPGSLATAGKTRAETDVLRKQASAKELADASTALASAATTITTQLGKPVAAIAASGDQRRKLGLIALALEAHSTSLVQPGAPAQLDAIIKGIKATQKQLTDVQEVGSQSEAATAKQFWQAIKQAGTEVGAAVQLISPKEEAPATITLYEVLMDENGTTLREVQFK